MLNELNGLSLLNSNQSSFRVTKRGCGLDFAGLERHFTFISETFLCLSFPTELRSESSQEGSSCQAVSYEIPKYITGEYI